MFAIDSHHHIWDPSRGDFTWMGAEHEPINKVFSVEDLAPLLTSAQVSHTILVQTWSSLEETKTFLDLAGKTDFIAGVVGWIDLTKDAVAQLDRLKQHPAAKYLKGIRHQVHDEADPNWLLRADVQASLLEIARRGLVYDLLIRPRELAASATCVERQPDLKFVIDHIAKPRIADGWDADWEEGIARLAVFKDRVWIKLSGLVTEADWANWSADDIVPYINHVINLFGADRVMTGSDWPVCTLAADYGSTLDLVRAAIAGRPAREQEQILRTSAIEAYSLNT